MTVPLILTQQSGSVGETVFSRNQHGPYIRDRTVPTDPATALQVAVRTALAQCVTAWRATLTETERQAWNLFAHAVRVRTTLGRRTNAGGLGMYIRANVPRLQAAVGISPRVDQAPTLLTSAQFTPITRVVLNVVDDTIHPFWDRDDAWSAETGAAMLFWVSAPKPLTRNHWTGPYRFAGKISGRLFPPLQSPATIPIPVPAALGERVFVRFRVTRADGRLSHDARLPADTVPQVAPLPLSARMRPGLPRRVVLTFDDLIRVETHSTAPWQVTFNSRVFTVIGVPSGLNPSTELTLLLNRAGTTLLPDQVVFAPPPADVNGLLTGLPAAAFTIPLTL